MGHRKRPSLHIRFKEFAKLDALEIWAHRRGQKLVPWARTALLKQARHENVEEIIDNAARLACLETALMLRELVGEEASDRAIDRVQKFKHRVELEVEKNNE